MRKVGPAIWSIMALVLLAMALLAHFWNREQKSLSDNLRRLAEAKTNQQKIELIERILPRYRWLDKHQRTALRNMLALNYGKEGRLREMEDIYRGLLEEYPEDHQTLNNLAYEWARRGINLDSAEALTLKALKIGREELSRQRTVAKSDEEWQGMWSQIEGTYLDTYGWILYKKEQYDTSRNVLQRAMELTNDPIVSYHYGMALYKTGHLDSAIVRLAVAVAANTEDSLEARETLKNVYLQRHKSLSGLDGVIADAWKILAEERYLSIPLESGTLVGSHAPDFTLRGLDGYAYTLSRLRGRVVILDFWARWCEPCRKTMPLVQKVWSENRERPVVVWGINLDDPKDLGGIRKFVTDESLDYPILLGGRMGQGVDRIYQVTGIPTILVIDKKGIIRFRHIGYRKNLDQLLSDNIELLLKEL